MKARPRYSDFELDYDKFPKNAVSGMNDIKRMDYRDALFNIAIDKWMDEAEKEIKDMKEFLRFIEGAFWNDGSPLQERIDDLKKIAKAALKE